MAPSRSVFVVAWLSVLLGSANLASASVVVVTSGAAAIDDDPSFWIGSYYPVAPTISRAFPFTVLGSEPLTLETLVVAAHRFDGGGTAVFAIREDDAGMPGLRLGAFITIDLDADQRRHEIGIAGEAPLVLPGATYWLSAESPAGEYRWNLAGGPDGNGAFGDTAFKRLGGQWTPRSGNLAAFTLLGVPIPEPTAGWLLLGCGFGVPRRRR